MCVDVCCGRHWDGSGFSNVSLHARQLAMQKISGGENIFHHRDGSRKKDDILFDWEGGKDEENDRQNGITTVWVCHDRGGKKWT